MFGLLTALISAVLAQAPPSGTPGSIQGIVCEVTTCRPIAGARLAVSLPGNQASRRTAVTDIAGKFRFQQLPAGKYQLGLEADNYATAGILPFINVTDEGNVEDLKIEMSPLGTISGLALDEAGNPLSGARIEAMAFRQQGYFQLLTPISTTDTDDRGQFRIPALEPDEYYIRISPPIDKVIKDTYPITYYPNATDPATASKVKVTRGAEISGIDTRLPSRGVNVRGRIVNPKNDSPRTAVALMLRSPSVFVLPSLSLNTADETSDDFELRGVAPGSYYVYAITKGNGQSGPEWVRLPLEVADKDVENVTIPIIPAGTVKGRVTIAGDATEKERLDLSGRLGAATTELVPGNAGVRAAPVDRNGEFQFPRLSEMRLFLSDKSFSDTWFISSVRFDGTDVISTGFSAAPGKEGFLEVVISNASGTLAGVIKDRQEKPVPAGRIVLLPELSRRSNPFLIRTGVAVERGEFTMEIIPPGEYTAIALPDEDQFTPAFLRDLQSVEKYERFGQHVHIGARETTRMDLTVAPAEP